MFLAVYVQVNERARARAFVYENECSNRVACRLFRRYRSPESACLSLCRSALLALSPTRSLAPTHSPSAFPALGRAAALPVRVAALTLSSQAPVAADAVVLWPLGCCAHHFALGASGAQNNCERRAPQTKTTTEQRIGSIARHTCDGLYCVCVCVCMCMCVGHSQVAVDVHRIRTSALDFARHTSSHTHTETEPPANTCNAAHCTML